jgi:AcrR family transcriptional regulator/DNA-binding MarR family transcriptional regulator
VSNNLSTLRARRERTQTTAWDNGSEPGPLTLGEIQRARILGAMSEILSEDGSPRVSVTRVIRRARVPRVAFYQHFSGSDDALLALVENAVDRTSAVIGKAVPEHAGWQQKTRAGLLAALELFEAEPQLARACLIHSHHPEAAMRRLRRDTLALLTRHIAEGARRGQTGALSAEGTAHAVLGILETRLQAQDRPRLSTLAGELMSFIVLPYRGASAARAEWTRGALAVKRARGLESTGRPGTPLRMTYRTMRVLVAIGTRPGLSNLGVAEQAGIGDQGQISKLLKRLQAVGLTENSGGGQELGTSNAWRLTEEGRRIERSILDHVPRRR